MAGLPWFELDTDFADHPKVVALAARLGEPLADAYLARIFAYCYRHATDRFPADVAPAVLEQAARWRGKAGHLFAALKTVGSLDTEGDQVVVHGVADRLQPHLAKLEADRERARARRATAAKSIGRPASVAGTSARRPRDVRRDKDRDRSGSTPIPPSLEASWLESIPEAERAAARAEWEALVARVKRSAYPDALPQLWLEAREQLQATWAERREVAAGGN